MRCNNMNEFYQHILSDKQEYDDDIIITLLQEDEENSDFYLLCREFVNLAITSERYHDKIKNEVSALYKFADIDELAKSVKRFVDKYSKINVETTLIMIKHRYKDAITHKEYSENAGKVPNEKMTGQFGFISTFYDFTDITCWDQITRHIIEKIK